LVKTPASSRTADLISFSTIALNHELGIEAMPKTSSMKTTSVPASSILCDLLDEAPHDAVTLAWIIERLHERSFGLIMLLLALFALVPGLSLIAGLLAIWIAAQMILARPRPTLPRFVSGRTVSAPRVAWLVARMVPVLRWLERFIRPRWSTPFTMTRRVVGAMLLLLGVSLFSPVPLSNFIPALVIMGMALAYLEKDGVMLTLALVSASASLVVTAVMVRATVYGIQVLEGL
jgi:hypothetical protein